MTRGQIGANSLRMIVVVVVVVVGAVVVELSFLKNNYC